MTQRLITHLRTHVAELRRLEREGAVADEVAERKRLILQLQEHLASDEAAVAPRTSVPSAGQRGR